MLAEDVCDAGGPAALFDFFYLLIDFVFSAVLRTYVFSLFSGETFGCNLHMLVCSPHEAREVTALVQADLEVFLLFFHLKVSDEWLSHLSAPH